MSDNEEEEVVPPKVLTIEQIKKGLSQLGRIYDGTSFAYLKLDLSNQELDEYCPELENYKHVRSLTLSGNRLKELDILKAFTYVLQLESKGNLLPSLEVFNSDGYFTYLQVLNLSGNAVQELGGINLPSLVHLNLSSNAIASAAEFPGHDTLKVLELRGNKLTTMTGLRNMPNLEELYLAENSLVTIDGLQGLPKLKKLHLRKNTIASIEEDKLPDLPVLEYLNIRENEFAETNQLAFLHKFKALQKLGAQECPLNPEPSGDVRKEVIIVLPIIQIFNKEPITEEEREESALEIEDRKRIAEDARREAEEAARLAAEQGEEGEEKEEEDN